uniref:Peptidase S1 domain-containing protein n=1 Tax=Elaeophora elaphi TaxID=1147741 RepID=A0A158Q842_9BILA
MYCRNLCSIIVSSVILSLIPNTMAIIGGEEKDWNRFGFLVKIFSREESSNIVTSCTGTIISTQLILTSSYCLLNATTGRRLFEFIVTVQSLKRPKTLPAEVVEIGQTWGILKIPEMPISTLCPPIPAPKRVAQLNVRPSLLQSSVVNIDVLKLKKKKCWIVGFATTDNATEFIKQEKIHLINIQSINPVKDKSNYFWSPIVANETACWDDAGAALFCSTQNWGHVLVGIFQHLIAPKKPIDPKREDEKMNMTDSCSRAIEMRFSKTTNQQKIFDVIQKFDVAAFISIYQNCFREIPYHLEII